MPVRSLNSPVLRWPEGNEVRGAARTWALELLQRNPQVIKVGYIGSYARGEEGVGSDLDLLVVLKDSDLAFERRGLLFDTSALPVPCDLLAYTSEEFESILARDDRFAEEFRERTVWFESSGGMCG